MIGFTKYTDAHFTSKEKRAELYRELGAIAALLGILALAIGVRLWVFLPGLFR